MEPGGGLRKAKRPLGLAQPGRRRTLGYQAGKPDKGLAFWWLEVPMSGEVQRWSKRRKLEIVTRLFSGESLEDVSREVGVEISRLEKWRDRGVRRLEEGLREREP